MSGSIIPTVLGRGKGLPGIGPALPFWPLMVSLRTVGGTCGCVMWHTLMYYNEGIMMLKAYWKLNFLLSWIDVRMSLTWARLLLPAFEKSVLCSAVSCTSQKHRLWKCVSVLPLDSYASSGQLPEVSESQVPYNKSGTIIGLLLTLNGLGSRKCLARVQPIMLHIEKCFYYSQSICLCILSGLPTG